MEIKLCLWESAVTAGTTRPVQISGRARRQRPVARLSLTPSRDTLASPCSAHGAPCGRRSRSASGSERTSGPPTPRRCKATWTGRSPSTSDRSRACPRRRRTPFWAGRCPPRATTRARSGSATGRSRSIPGFGNPYNDIGSYLIALGRPKDAVPWLRKAMGARALRAPPLPAREPRARVREARAASTPPSPSCASRSPSRPSIGRRASSCIDSSGSSTEPGSEPGSRNRSPEGFCGPPPRPAQAAPQVRSRDPRGRWCLDPPRRATLAA